MVHINLLFYLTNLGYPLTVEYIIRRFLFGLQFCVSFLVLQTVCWQRFVLFNIECLLSRNGGKVLRMKVSAL